MPQTHPTFFKGGAKGFRRKLGDYVIVAKDARLEAESVDVSHEGGEDPNYNDCLFVEDDCEEEIDDSCK